MATLVVCGDPSTLPAADTTGLLRYRLTWDTARATPHAQGGWVFRTDRGVTVWLQQAWMVSYSTELIHCPTQTSGLRSWLAARAHAGHGQLYDNEARFATPVAEDLTAAQDFTWAEATVPDYRFCQAHYLVARGDDDRAPGAGPDLTGVSVLLRAARLRAGHWEPFEIIIGRATATLVDIDPVDTGHGGFEVRIERDLGGLLDGVDLDAIDDVVAPRQVLRNIREGTRVTVSALR